MVEFIVFDRLVSGKGRDMSGDDRAATSVSVNGSRKVDWLNLSLGGSVDCFTRGCAQSGIWISTCLGVARPAPPLAVVQSRVRAASPGVRGESEIQVESLPVDRKVEIDPDRASICSRAMGT